MSKKSLSERLEFILEEDGACATCSGGGGSEGDGGEGFGAGGEADKESDFNQLVKGLKMIKKLKSKKIKEGYKEPNFEKMTGQALKAEIDADNEPNKDKKHKLFDRARKIRNEIK